MLIPISLVVLLRKKVGEELIHVISKEDNRVAFTLISATVLFILACGADHLGNIIRYVAPELISFSLTTKIAGALISLTSAMAFGKVTWGAED
jgi:hypothetical protein